MGAICPDGVQNTGFVWRQLHWHFYSISKHWSEDAANLGLWSRLVYHGNNNVGPFFYIWPSKVLAKKRSDLFTYLLTPCSIDHIDGISLLSMMEQHYENGVNFFISHLWLSGPWAPSQCKDGFSMYVISIIKIRRSWDRLIFIMGIPVLARRHL